MRCFLAVPVSDAVRTDLQALLRRLHARLPAARFVPPDALHLTLHFFEDLSPEQAAGVRDAAREGCASVASFPASLAGLGVFPDARRPRVLWVGVAEGAPGLASLHAAIAGGLRGRGLPLDDRPFRAHLTLARFRAPDPGVAAALAQGDAVRPPPFRVDEVLLFESVLGPRGAVHTVLDRFALAR